MEKELYEGKDRNEGLRIQMEEMKQDGNLKEERENRKKLGKKKISRGRTKVCR